MDRYDEALAKARAGKTLDEIFPEMNENEDERIRKLLIWQVHRNIEDETNDLAQSVYDGIKGHDPDLEESIEDWKRCLAYLEKQKENPKTADSIPSNCVSDAKWASSVLTNAIVSLSDAVDYNCNEPFRYKQEIDDLKKLREEIEKQKEQKPAEWSEEHIADIFEKVGLAKIAREQGNDELTNALQDAMLELSKVENTEWSEEDNEVLQQVIADIEDLITAETSPGFLAKYNKHLAWLKSLRPQPKVEPTLLDENIIEAAVAFVEQNDHFNVLRGIDKHTVIKALRSLKPHWKPSEEQMEALKKTTQLANFGSDAKRRDALLSLYEQLKKLM